MHEQHDGPHHRGHAPPPQARLHRRRPHPGGQQHPVSPIKGARIGQGKLGQSFLWVDRVQTLAIISDVPGSISIVFFWKHCFLLPY